MLPCVPHSKNILTERTGWTGHRSDQRGSVICLIYPVRSVPKFFRLRYICSIPSGGGQPRRGLPRREPDIKKPPLEAGVWWTRSPYSTSFRSLPQGHLPGVSDIVGHIPSPLHTYLPLRLTLVISLPQLHFMPSAGILHLHSAPQAQM